MNGIRITHEELRAIHQNMRVAIAAATREVSLTGPRLLDPSRGERYVLEAHRRDKAGNLLVSVAVYLPAHRIGPYVRRIRLIKGQPLKGMIKVEVARDPTTSHT